MHYYHDFSESYYNHACVILPEKDVIYTDIVGNNLQTRIKRWWKDLFLLSPTAERSKCFYASSLAMSIDRFRHYRNYPNRIHPMSKFSYFWDCLILHTFITNKFIFRFTSTFLFDELPMPLFYFGAFLELVIFSDLYVNMKTGYINNESRQVVLDTKASIRQFCTKKLFLHFASAFPMHWFMFVRYGSRIDCGLCKTNRFICALKIISVISLYRVYEMSKFWIQKSNSAVKTHCFRLLRIAALGSITMSQFYDLCEAVTFLTFISNGHMVHTSLLSLASALKYNTEMYVQDINEKLAISEFSRIFRSLFLFTFEQNKTVFHLDMVAALLGHIITKAFFAWSLIECYSIVNRVMYPKERLMKVKISALNMIIGNQLSNEFRSKVEQYFDYKPTALKIVERKNFLYKCLPEMFKREIKIECYLKYMMRIPFFHDWPISVLEQMAYMLERDVFLRNDIVSEAAVPLNGLMIVEQGVLAVYSKHYRELGHLIDGDYFGELSLVTDKELCMSFVVAVTHCTILILEKMTFRRIIMKAYPRLYFEMKSQLKEKFHSTDSRHLSVSKSGSGSFSRFGGSYT